MRGVDLHGEVVDRLDHGTERLAAEDGLSVLGELEHDGNGVERLTVAEAGGSAAA